MSAAPRFPRRRVDRLSGYSVVRLFGCSVLKNGDSIGVLVTEIRPGRLPMVSPFFKRGHGTGWVTP
jgi:hypothetical protein